MHGYIKRARRLVVTVVGFTLLLAGLALVVLPGPAIVVIPVALGILATEYVWARRLLRKTKERLTGTVNETEKT
jgi:uncharacterized protein (TIGR02611 family)